MSVMYEIFYLLMHIGPMVLALMVLLALACYGFQMVRLFFRF